MSRKSFNFIAGLVILISSSLTLIAQEKQIEKEEFEVIKIKAYENLNGKIYRLKITNETFLDRNKVPTSTYYSVSEFLPPDKGRFYSETKSSKVNLKTERIWIGQKSYTRQNDEEWKEEPMMGGSRQGSGIGSTLNNTEYQFLGETFLDNQKANFFEVKQKQTTTVDNEERESITTSRYWISKDGYLLKVLSETEITGSPRFRRNTWIYEYDTNIKIEAPVMKFETKQKPN